MENTYLDAQAMLKRINTMQNQSETIFREIEKTRDVMNRLRNYFEGSSANRLQKKFDDIAGTYKDLFEYLREKAQLMDELVANTKAADEDTL